MNKLREMEAKLHVDLVKGIITCNTGDSSESSDDENIEQLNIGDIIHYYSKVIMNEAKLVSTIIEINHADEIAPIALSSGDIMYSDDCLGKLMEYKDMKLHKVVGKFMPMNKFKLGPSGILCNSVAPNSWGTVLKHVVKDNTKNLKENLKKKGLSGYAHGLLQNIYSQSKDT